MDFPRGIFEGVEGTLLLSQGSFSSAFAEGSTQFQMPAEDRPGQHPVGPPRGPLPHAVDCPPLLVAAAIYDGFGHALRFHTALPWWVLLPLGDPLPPRPGPRRTTPHHHL